jgi:uncharacterized RDD family membrane protein YckC
MVNSGDVHVTGRRVVATIIDGVVLGCGGGGLLSLVGVHTSVSSLDLTKLRTGGNLLLLAVVVAYYVALEGLAGRTVGKFVTGIRVVDAATGAPPGAGKALVRTLLRIVDGAFGYLLGFVVVLMSDRRRRLGDMAARTLVVRA